MMVNLNHRLISPKWHVDKVYYAKIDKEVRENDIVAFKNGITLDDGYKCKEAKLEILSSSQMKDQKLDLQYKKVNFIK